MSISTFAMWLVIISLYGAMVLLAGIGLRTILGENDTRSVNPHDNPHEWRAIKREALASKGGTDA